MSGAIFIKFGRAPATTISFIGWSFHRIHCLPTLRLQDVAQFPRAATASFRPEPTRLSPLGDPVFSGPRRPLAETRLGCAQFDTNPARRLRECPSRPPATLPPSIPELSTDWHCALT